MDSIIGNGRLYSYADNIPTNQLDSDGTDAIWINESSSAGTMGHTGLMVQDDNGEWYYFFWGPASENFSKEIVTGTENNSVIEKITTNGADLTDVNQLKLILKNSSGIAKQRADLITEAYYFRGDYTATYNKALLFANSNESYSVVLNNCLQKTLDAFNESDKRFSLLYCGSTLNSTVPNIAKRRVALIPSDKNAFPWAALIDCLLELH